MKFILPLLALLALPSLSQAAVTISPFNGLSGFTFKNYQTGNPTGGVVKVGWITNPEFKVTILTELKDLAGNVFFLGGGGNAGTSSISLTQGVLSGSITGFNPSTATGEPSYASKQLFVLVMESPVPDLATAPGYINWALVSKPVISSSSWSTGTAGTATKSLPMSNLTASDVLHGKLETDGQFSATTGIGLTPSNLGSDPPPATPEPGSTVLLALAGLLASRRRRAETAPLDK